MRAVHAEAFCFPILKASKPSPARSRLPLEKPASLRVITSNFSAFARSDTPSEIRRQDSPCNLRALCVSVLNSRLTITDHGETEDHGERTDKTETRPLPSARNLDTDFSASYSHFRSIREMHRTEINRFALTYRFSFREADWRMRAREATDSR